jgi:hypothetical protein
MRECGDTVEKSSDFQTKTICPHFMTLNFWRFPVGFGIDSTGNPGIESFFDAAVLPGMKFQHSRPLT